MENNTNKSSYVLRMVAGGYLMYLAYNILVAVFNGEATTHVAILGTAAVIFMALGAIILISGIRGMKKAAHADATMLEEEEANAESEEAAEAEETENVETETVEAAEDADETETADE